MSETPRDAIAKWLVARWGFDSEPNEYQLDDADEVLDALAAAGYHVVPEYEMVDDEGKHYRVEELYELGKEWDGLARLIPINEGETRDG